MRSTLSISAGLAVVSVVLTTLWISHGPRPQSDQTKKASAAVPISQQPQRHDAKGQAIRIVGTAPATNSAVSNLASRQAREGMDPVPLTGIPTSDASSTQPEQPRQAADAGAPTRLADVAPVSSLRTDTTANNASEASATGGTIDLNSASVEQLNALGAGMIGKRIVEFRPYAMPEDLVTRRVLKKADYETIRSAITAR